MQAMAHDTVVNEWNKLSNYVIEAHYKQKHLYEREITKGDDKKKKNIRSLHV